MSKATRRGNLEARAIGFGAALIFLAMVILVGDLLAQTVVGPWLVRDIHPLRGQMVGHQHYGQLKVLGPGLPYSYRRESNDTGNLPVLVDTHDSFVACGMNDLDSFGARVVADRAGMPWRVEGLEGPAAQRACLAEVLATLPLEEELAGEWSVEVTFRTDVRTLREEWDRRHPRPPFVRWQDEWRVPGEPGSHTSRATDRPGSDALLEASSLVSCASATPAVTRLDLRYEDGQLVRVESSPSVA